MTDQSALNVADDSIHVTSHVARDLLQTAAMFNTDKKVAWEYISNGLQYSQVGVPARVAVAVHSRKKAMSIVDNGCGMDWKDLRNFWTMHGENLERLAGRPGRGRFGTGKAAAFGIAEVLRVGSVKDGHKSCVELRRVDIESMNTGDPIPVRTICKEVLVDEAIGTTIDIERIRLRHIDQAGIIKYVERHLAHWPKDATVIVNDRLCEYAEPPVAFTRTFTPTEGEAAIFGRVPLEIKVSKSAIDKELRGIAMFSKGVWHESTLAGAEDKDMSQYIFGEIDVPAIEDDRSVIPAFDHTRSLQLNRENELVATLIAFIGRSIESVRQKLLATERERRKTDDARRLQRQASAIADILNEDFAQFRARLAKVRAKATDGGDFGGTSASTGDDPSDVVPGSELPGGDGPVHHWDKREDEPTSRSVTSSGRAWGVNDGDEPDMAKPGGGEGSKRRPKGGFSVAFKPLGTEFDRSQYVSEERTIYINLDHPQVSAAKGSGSDEDPTFRRLAYEIAFTEYAVALAYEMDNRDEYLEPWQPIADIREHINRLARRAAVLYQG